VTVLRTCSLKTTISRNIKRLREARALSQEQFARRIDNRLTGDAVGKWERGSGIRVSRLEDICEAFDIYLSTLTEPCTDDFIADIMRADGATQEQIDKHLADLNARQPASSLDPFAEGYRKSLRDWLVHQPPTEIVGTSYAPSMSMLEIAHRRRERGR
jgi:transcriptional regulator with XRE-family HTH domain